MFDDSIIRNEAGFDNAEGRRWELMFCLNARYREREAL